MLVLSNPLLVGAMGIALASGLTTQCTTQLVSGGGYPGASSVVLATTLWDPDGPGPAPNLVVLGGIFATAGTATSNRIAAVDPASGAWFSFGSGFTSSFPEVQSLAVLPNGHLVAAGRFTLAGGVAVNNIAEWNGTAWIPLGLGLDAGPYVPNVRLAVLPTGDLVAAGYFSLAGGIPVNNIARWDGSAWHAMGVGTDNDVRDLAVAPNGDLIVGGLFSTAGGFVVPGVARWNNNVWTPLPSPAGSGLRCIAVEATSAGHVIAAFTDGTLGVQRWNGLNWVSLGPVAGVRDLCALPNGDLVAGGNFAVVNGVAAAGVARWNGMVWSPLGTGIGGYSGNFNIAYSITALGGGAFALGGQFLSAGGVGAENVARWDGAQWRSFGGGASDGVSVLVALPDGGVVAGGRFATVGGAIANGVAQWRDGDWTGLGDGVSGTLIGPGPVVLAAAQLQGGDLVVGGQFLRAGGVTANHVARFDGSSWTNLGAGVGGSSSAAVQALAELRNGDIVAAGSFSSAGGVPVNNIARWNGTAWSAMGGGFANPVHTMVVMPNGDLIVGGFIFGGVRRWNGNAWSGLGAGITMPGGATGEVVASLALTPHGELIVGGVFTAASGVAVRNVARWDGVAWSALGSGLADAVSQVVTLPDGGILACTTDGARVGRAWRWDGAVWSAIATFPPETTIPTTALVAALRRDGDVVVGGSFLTAGSLTAYRLANLVPTCRATSASFGAGCAGTGGVLAASATALPWLGATLETRCTGFGAGSFGIAVLGLLPVSTPLTQLHPAGGVGCTLLATLDIAELRQPSNGIATWQLDVPVDPALAGGTLHQQWLEVDLGAQQQLTGLFASNGLQLVVGSL